ncbi:DUF1294 domain-containing protein [Dokdonella sp.]|uniref:DUF1294 domain-containing protein n=1 Tax=Dokdonella sp. TaxID=2291710 RepID=UPI0037845218
MRFAGRITEWNDARGFGFVVPNGGGERAFVHIKAFDRRGSRPFEGALVSYEVGTDERQRPQALAVRFAGAPSGRKHSRHPFAWRSVVGATMLVLLAIATVTSRLPVAIAALYFVASAIAFVMYGIDKSAARSERSRTPENTLHLVGLCGGWPGALIAQDVFRHKSRKVEFQVVFWLSVVVNVALAAWLLLTGHMPAIERVLRDWIR